MPAIVYYQHQLIQADERIMRSIPSPYCLQEEVAHLIVSLFSPEKRENKPSFLGHSLFVRMKGLYHRLGSINKSGAAATTFVSIFHPSLLLERSLFLLFLFLNDEMTWEIKERRYTQPGSQGNTHTQCTQGCLDNDMRKGKPCVIRLVSPLEQKNRNVNSYGHPIQDRGKWAIRPRMEARAPESAHCLCVSMWYICVVHSRMKKKKMKMGERKMAVRPVPASRNVWLQLAFSVTS